MSKITKYTFHEEHVRPEFRNKLVGSRSYSTPSVGALFSSPIRASRRKRGGDIVVECDPTCDNLQSHSLSPLPISYACAIPHHFLLSCLLPSPKKHCYLHRSVHDPKPHVPQHVLNTHSS
ncbi:hypothetical protein L1987_58796 [Smallanthus sonchifolius]|uniref:Uncharacterized protein n=1 Tax=Smallanthus sonchifolius TaxID=185202 RepID=A0ACB9D3G5_9ASTR|nr:hypothetical protein L1987_58796 [Smallanthus sonchifolius]